MPGFFAAVAAEAEEIIEAIRAANPVGRPRNDAEETSQLIDEYPNDRRTDAKVAETFNTNRDDETRPTLTRHATGFFMGARRGSVAGYIDQSVTPA